MASDPPVSVPNPVQRRDAEVLIGILAVLDGVIWGGSLDEWTTGKVAERLVRNGMLAADHDRHDVHRALDDLNQRLRYAVGEYDSAPSSVPLPSDGDAGAVTPAEREARWTLFVRFAIEAASEAEARVVVREALAGLDGYLPLRGDPVVRPRWRRNPDEMWVAELAPDLTHLQVITPDDAQTRCRFVQGYFPMGVNWILPRNTERETRAEWPPDVWQRQPDRDDVLLHPAIRAVMIYCAANRS